MTNTTKQARKEIKELLERHPYNFLNDINYLIIHLEEKQRDLLNLNKNYNRMSIKNAYQDKLLHNAKLIRVAKEML